MTAQTEKDKLETDLMKQQEKVNHLESQVNKAAKDRENLQSEMEMLLDRINKLSELLDKNRVKVDIIEQGEEPPFHNWTAKWSLS